MLFTRNNVYAIASSAATESILITDRFTNLMVSMSV